MHELFLTAVVSAADFDRATAVLQGFCAMGAWSSTHRVLFFAGPTQARGLGQARSIVPSPYGKLWQELNQQLSRQSYIVQARYEVFRDRDFGEPLGGGGGGGGTEEWAENGTVSAANTGEKQNNWKENGKVKANANA